MNRELANRQAHLKRIGLGCKWEPKDWHLKLVAYLEPMAVYGTFGHARLAQERGRTVLGFMEPHKFAAAGNHRMALEACFGGEVVMELNYEGKIKTELWGGKQLQRDIARSELSRRNFKERNLQQ